MRRERRHSHSGRKPVQRHVGARGWNGLSGCGRRDEIVEAISGCTITSGDSNTFYGYIDPDAGSAFLTAEFTADCLVEGNIRGYTFVIRFSW